MNVRSNDKFEVRLLKFKIHQLKLERKKNLNSRKTGQEPSLRQFKSKQWKIHALFSDCAMNKTTILLPEGLRK